MSPASGADISRIGERNEVHLVKGEEARALLGNAAFIAAWETLERSCPWTTPFQRAAFTIAWCAAYPRATPVLVFRGNPSGELRALFPLALLDDGRLTVIGAEQAEYQGWIAMPGEDDFIIAALDQLKSGTAAIRLRLQFLPPGIPLGPLDRDPRWGRGRSILTRTVSRSLMRLDSDEIAKTLKKSGNRSKMNRLKQLGAVRLDRLNDRVELAACIDEIAAFCDVRQCGINGVMPFRDDPAKKEFYLSLLEQPGLLHATVLRVGDRIAAAHLGVASARDVALGVIAHSPFLAAHSPGKLLLLLLGDRMAQEGFEYLDLTPEGTYKDRFASHADEVEVREIYFRPRAFFQARLREAARRAVKRAAVATGRVLGIGETEVLDRTRTIGARLSVGTLRRAPRDLAARLSGRRHDRRESCVYRLSATTARALDAASSLARDSVDDLRHYEPAATTARTRQEFSRDAIERLEKGHHVYTLVEGQRLAYCAWLIPDERQIANESGSSLELPPASSVLEDGITQSSASARGVHELSMRQRAKDAATLWSADWVYMSVPGDDTASRRSIESLGFELVATLRHEGSARVRPS